LSALIKNHNDIKMLHTKILLFTYYFTLKTKTNPIHNTQTTKIMKNFILILITTFTLSCCSKDDNKTPIQQLPQATTTGANTAGCLVDGKAFLPKGYSAIGNLTCVYQDGLNFVLGLSEDKNNVYKSIAITSLNQRLAVGEIYQLKEYGANSKFGEYTTVYNSIQETRFRTNATITGELKITNHNFDKAILSGTFWFDAVNSDGTIVKIREGRFDMHY
jgi:hypothetical protein